MSRGNMLNFLDSARVYMDSALQKPGSTISRTVNLRRFLQRNILKRSSPIRTTHSGPQRQCRRRKSAKSSSAEIKANKTATNAAVPSQDQRNSGREVLPASSGTIPSAVNVNYSPLAENRTLQEINTPINFESSLSFPLLDDYSQGMETGEVPSQHIDQHDHFPLDSAIYQSGFMTGLNIPAQSAGLKSESGCQSSVCHVSNDTGACGIQPQFERDGRPIIPMRGETENKTGDILYSSMLTSGLTFTLSESDHSACSRVSESHNLCNPNKEIPNAPFWDPTLGINGNSLPFKVNDTSGVSVLTLPVSSSYLHTEMNDFYALSTPTLCRNSLQNQTLVGTDICSFSESSSTAKPAFSFDMNETQPSSPLQHGFSFANALQGLDATCDLQSLDQPNANFDLSFNCGFAESVDGLDVNCDVPIQNRLPENKSISNSNLMVPSQHSMGISSAMPVQNVPLDAPCTVPSKDKPLEIMNELNVSSAMHVQDHSSESMKSFDVNTGMPLQSKSSSNTVGALDMNSTALLDQCPLPLTGTNSENISGIDECANIRQAEGEEDEDETLQQLLTSIEIMSSTELHNTHLHCDSLPNGFQKGNGVSPSCSQIGNVYSADKVTSCTRWSTCGMNHPVTLNTQTDTHFSFASSSFPVSLPAVAPATTMLSTDYPWDSLPPANIPVSSTQPSSMHIDDQSIVAPYAQLPGRNIDDNEAFKELSVANILPSSAKTIEDLCATGPSSPWHSLGVSDVLLTLAREKHELEYAQQKDNKNNQASFENCDELFGDFISKPLHDSTINMYSMPGSRDNCLTYLDDIENSLALSTTDLIPAIDDQNGDIFSFGFGADLNLETTTCVSKMDRAMQTVNRDEAIHTCPNNEATLSPERCTNQTHEVENTTEQEEQFLCPGLREEENQWDSCSEEEDALSCVLSELLSEQPTKEGNISRRTTTNSIGNRTSLLDVDEDEDSTDNESEATWEPPNYKLPPFHLVFCSNVSRLHKHLKMSKQPCHG